MQDASYRAGVVGAVLAFAIAVFIVARVTGFIGTPIRFGRGDVRTNAVESESSKSIAPIDAPRSKTPCLEDVDWRTVAIELDYSPSLGYSPMYRVTIACDGHVNYTGRYYVRTLGPATKEISGAKVRELVAQFLDARFFDLDDSYTERVSDCSANTLELHVNGQRKRVLNYWAFDAGANNYAIHRALSDLASSINSAVEIESWIGDREYFEWLSQTLPEDWADLADK